MSTTRKCIHQARTKIVATVGPACDSAEALAKPATETPPAEDEPGLDAAVADLVEDAPKAEPEGR